MGIQASILGRPYEMDPWIQVLRVGESLHGAVRLLREGLVERDGRRGGLSQGEVSGHSPKEVLPRIPQEVLPWQQAVRRLLRRGGWRQVRAMVVEELHGKLQEVLQLREQVRGSPHAGDGRRRLQLQRRVQVSPGVQEVLQVLAWIRLEGTHSQQHNSNSNNNNNNNNNNRNSNN